MIRYGIWYNLANTWCTGYYSNIKSKPDDNKGYSQFFDINEAYMELEIWNRGINHYEVREVK